MGCEVIDDGLSPQTQGYLTSTDKSRRAEADGRIRRVNTVLAKAVATPAWVTAEFPPSDFDGLVHVNPNNTLQIPAALANRKRAAKLSVGFRCQILEQLAEERARLASRLESLAVACDGAFATHSASADSSRAASPRTPTRAREDAVHRETSWRSRAKLHGKGIAAAAAATAAKSPLRGLTHGSASLMISEASDPEHTPARPATPRTVLRPAVAAATAMMAAAATTRADRRDRTSPPASSQPHPAAVRSLIARTVASSGISTPSVVERRTVRRTTDRPASAAAAAAAAAPLSTGTSSGVRRRLSFKDDAEVDEAMTGPGSVAGSSSRAASYTTRGAASPRRLKSALRRGAASSASASSVSAAVGPSAALAGAALAEAVRAAAAGRRLAAVAAVGVLDDVMGVRSSAATTPGGSPTRRRLAWQEPVDLLPAGSVQKFAGARDGLWPCSQEALYGWAASELDAVYDTSRLGHRERLHVGIAELNSELCSSWRALVASGAV